MCSCIQEYCLYRLEQADMLKNLQDFQGFVHWSGTFSTRILKLHHYDQFQLGLFVPFREQLGFVGDAGTEV